MRHTSLLLAALAIPASSLQAGASQPEVEIDSVHHLEGVEVHAVRAASSAPFAFTELRQQELRSFATSGRELPILFSKTPGVLAWGENGLGTGTTYMRIRGAAGSRINVTLDGVPLNSAEDQTVFWANMNSYASLLSSVQIQRGVGTSSHGDGAFGGTISLEMAAPSTERFLDVTGSYGSYGTYHAGAKFSTGLLGRKFIFDGAYHETGTQGFLHGTRGRSGSYYGGLTWLGSSWRLSYKNVGNFEKTGQAWNGVVAGNNDASLMDAGVRTYRDLWNHGLGKFNPLYERIVFDYDQWTFPQDANGNYQTQRLRLRDGSEWGGATDNFWQNHNILSISWQPSAHWTHRAAVHYTYGYGYYKELKYDYKFAKFGLVYRDAEGKVIKTSDFIRKKGLRQHFYGALYDAHYADDQWDVTTGINLQQFRANHFGYLTYIAQADAEKQFLRDGSLKYYDSDAQKFDYSAYFKAAYHINRQWEAMMDLQYRTVSYRTWGANDKFLQQNDGTYAAQQLHIAKRFDFFNPKFGLTWHSGGHRAWASIAWASREPERNNYTDNGSYPLPKAEQLADLEAGYRFAARTWQVSFGGYWMRYHNQLVQTGQQSDIGENLTTNIARSYRLGVELEAAWQPCSWISLEGNAALSKNRITDFTEYVENWDEAQPEQIHYSRSTLAFSPSAILNGMLSLHHGPWRATWHTQWVSRQFLDNTENDLRALPSFAVSNVEAVCTLSSIRFLGVKRVEIGVDVNNVFNRRYAASGWVYSAVSKSLGYTADKRYYQIGFIPQAGTTFMTHVTLSF